ncbi:hypothetical protein BJF85_17200 [Saccharomonospora sp. CUA-673]|uniref:hypothetical protein n=1 Tax=Saccharomonospora sp. CUA-673 TaxID=1904969 RepID=UPI00096741CB|nr:hypothetical protein [Saccharomonospora sp. CUA-673]OLT46395.1 hypothetical protein BJF85_17200 [Saccharomonospora sp. CUA-673]
MGGPDQPRDSKGRWTKKRSVAVVGVTAVVAYGPVTGGMTAGTGGMSMKAGMTQASPQAFTKSTQAVKKGRPAQALRHLKLKRPARKVERALECGINSYGEVQRFLIRNPCRSLDRSLFTLDDEHGNRMVVSISWVRMPTSAQAARLRRIADVYGTGNVSPLPGHVVGAGDIEWTGRNYDSRRMRQTTVIAETEPVHGEIDPEYLDNVAELAVHFPRPKR